MGWQFPARLLSRLRGAPEARQRPEAAPDGGVVTRLFTCQRCGTTYICEAMAACPDCGGVVVRTPSERDLGYAAAEG